MWFNSLVFCFVMLCSADFLGFVDALKSGENGVCVVKISTRKTRVKWITINKWCGKKKCTKKKIESYTVPEEKIVCCNGWGYDVQSDSCGPICSTGCVGGHCVAPEVCRCEPPATLDPDHPNTCVQPICDLPCFNAQCVNNTCSCFSDFSPYNETHCYQCDNGYSINENFTCVPKCDNCTNGVCTAPENCSCDEGYTTVDGICQPECDICVNSTCVAPDECSCWEGYEVLNDSVCVPKCKDCEDNCVAPDVCICHQGYKNVSGTCEPICEGCDNGVCSSTGQCACNQGYVKNESSNVCVRNCERPIEKIESVLNNNYTLLPRTPFVKCPFSYRECKRRDKNLPSFNPRTQKCCTKPYTETVKNYICCPNWELNGGVCKAQCKLDCGKGGCRDSDLCLCDPPCFNGRCGAGSICECNHEHKSLNSTHCITSCEDGYYNDPDTLNCVPKCDRPCVNGTCTAPNTCTCNTGFEKDDDFTCVPKCTPECINGICVDVNHCSCQEGYRFESNTTCVPVCDGGCEHGRCIRPNICECNDGYMMKDGVCIPHCDKTCSNGVCSAPNVCTCQSGYYNNPENNFECLPICEPKCVNATCISPNTCSCNLNYKPAGDPWTCAPECKSCEHGDCIAPNVCRCHEGYSNATGECKPICDKSCKYGVCSEPNTCTCNNGYELSSEDSFTCTPKCDPGCVNAKCVLPNECSCHTGYQPTEDSNICKAQCKNCSHGDCVAPGKCKCHKGYRLEKGECSPVCHPDCINGICTAPNLCTCIDGYEKETKTSSVCKKPCEGPCDHGTCSLNGICRCNKGFEFRNNTCFKIQPVSCETCQYNCSFDDCSCVDGSPCVEPEVETEAAETRQLAGVELMGILAGAIVLVLMTLVVIVMHRLYRRRKASEKKNIDEGKDRYGSVVYTVPDTLLHRHDNDDLMNEEEAARTERLLTPELILQDEKL